MTVKTKFATEIKKLDGWRGDARLYQLDPPLDKMEFVVVSAVHILYGGGIETYIFAANAKGEVEDWGELSGSMKGTLDHAEALLKAGYEVA